MTKMVKCPKCGNVFERPRFGYKPVEYKLGMKMPGGIVSLGAVFACPKCGFEGSAKEFTNTE
ncbi:MAG: hypothetical protein QXV17_10890 [Candidatus Micrarchaeaceae archaeon]